MNLTRLPGLYLLFHASFSALPGLGQTLDQSNCVPAIGMVEHRVYHSDDNANGLATSGTGNTWDATAVTPVGITNTTTYRTPASSPYAATYPTTTICAQVFDGNQTSWEHFNVDATMIEFLGTNTNEFVGGRTACTFPFSLGSSFTDSYTIGGSPSTVVVEYVASGSIIAPWGTIPNVVMFNVNSGTYLFYSSNNLLDAIGSYTPSSGLHLWEVDLSTGIGSNSKPEVTAWPVPTSEILNVTLPYQGLVSAVVMGPDGRQIETFSANAPRITLDVHAYTSGAYLMLVSDAFGSRSPVRFIVR